MKEQLDRIEKATALIQAGAVTSLGAGRWHVQTDRHNVSYDVSLDRCNCYDSATAGNICRKGATSGPSIVSVCPALIVNRPSPESLTTIFEGTV
jgi:hypothetical protein